MHHLDRKIVLLITFVILGIVLAVQFRSVFNVNKQKSSVAIQVDSYKKQLEDKLNYEKDQIELIKENEGKKDGYLKTFAESKDDTYKKALGKSLDDVNLKAGLTDVKGKGIIIELDDAPERDDVNPNYLLIHDSDILRIVNELKKFGAQAISINDERLIAISEQVCAGPTIIVNKRRYAVPFIIKAIGEPDALFKGLDESDFVFMLRIYKIKVDITKSNDILIPKYRNAEKDLISGLEVVK